MKGYVITMQVDGDASTTYWDGTVPVQDIDKALFIESLASARQTAGSLQSGYTDRTINVLGANKGIQIDTPLTPPSIQNVLA